MDYFPLPPKGCRKDNHDVTRVVRESFKNVLTRQLFPENVAENAAKYTMDHEMLKEEADTVNAILEDIQQSKEGFEDIEGDVLVNHGEFMLTNDAVEGDEVLTEALKLKRVAAFKDLDADKADAYSLLQKDDLLPAHQAERLIDFRINIEKHGCLQPCVDSRSDLDLVPSKLPTRKFTLQPLEKNEIRSSTKKLSLRPLQQAETRTASKYTQKGVPSLKPEPAVVFTPYPKVVKFLDYLPNTSYEKMFKLTNVSKKPQTVVLQKLPTNPVFHIHAMSTTSKVAAGMSVYYKVLFKTDVFKDADDIVTFKTYGGQYVNVRLVSSREPPALQVFVCKDPDSFLNKLDIDSSCAKLFDDTRASALNYTIDCGQCFLGQRSRTTWIIRNDGGKGTFFLMTEDDWYFGDVKSIDEHFEMDVGEFEIQPTYFTVDKNEFAEVEVTFVPLCFGLQAQKCFLLCNNTQYEEFEIIGDGLYFEKHFVEIQVAKKKDRLSYFDHESEYYVYAGECLPQTTKSCIISVRNTCPLDLLYQWEVRKSVTHNRLTKLKQMEENWIHITNNVGSLCGRSTTDFEVIIHGDSYAQGLYSIVLGLYILDVPEASLAENTDFTVICKTRRDDDPLTPELLDVLVGEIEIACDIVAAEVHLVPHQMILPIELQPKESVVKQVHVSTSRQFSLRCKWKVFNKRNGQKCCVKVKPVEFILEPGVTTTCQITICAHTYADVQEKLMLFVNDGLLAKEYNVLAKVASPKVDISTNILDFGYITINLPLEKRFTLTNLCKDPVHWQLFEFTYDFMEKKLIEVKDSHVSQCCGVLRKYGGKVDVVYKVNAKEVHRWFSFIMVLITQPARAVLETPILVSYEVCQPKIIIHTPTSTSPILCISELLNIGVTIHAVICMHNASNVPSYFLWGSPVGKQKDSIYLTFSPKAGVIKPRDVFKATVTLTPKETGILEQIYVPCFVGRVEEPAMLTVMCAVDNIHVCFSLPTQDGKYKKIPWPPHIIDEYDLQYFDWPAYEDAAPTDTFTGVSYPDTKPCFLEILRCRPDYDQLAVDDYQNPKQSRLDENLAHLLSINCCEQTPESISDQSVNSQPPLTERFGSDLILEDYCIEIRGLPIKTPLKKTIKMHNLTPMTSCFTAEVTNYEALDVRPSSFEELLQKAGFQKDDNWEKLIYPGSGMVVKVDPPCRQFYAQQEVDIDIWIYANTWGVYVEEIVVELKDIPPFCFSMVIEVIGSPIEYPFALNSLHDTPLLRLGEIPIGCPEIKRQVKLKNVSSIPVSLFWHVFISLDEDSNKTRFNLVYHIKDMNAVEFRQTEEVKEEMKLLVSEYYGKEADTDIFQVQPRQINLLPNTITSIALTFKPEEYCKQYFNQQIQAVLVGFIDTAEEYRYKQNHFIRPVNTELEPTKVKMSGTLRLPLLELEHVKGDMRVTAFAADVVQSGSFSCTMRLVFKNTNTAVAKVGMHIKEPFQVLCLKTCGIMDEDSTVAAVEPGACVEVYVQCNVDKNYVEELAGTLYNRRMSRGAFAGPSDNSVIVRRNLNVHQKGVVLLVTPLDLKLYYPAITVQPVVINFGNVWIGNSAKSSFTIYNLSETTLHYSLEFTNQSARNVFIVLNTGGEVPKASGSKMGETTVEIRFVPNEVQWHNEVLRVVTDIRTYYREINLVANGTINQKFYKSEE